MKKCIQIILFISIVSYLGAQTLEGDAILVTQADVDAFGANNYTRVEGSMLVGNSQDNISDITDLSPLNSLQEVITPNPGEDVAIFINVLPDHPATLDIFPNLT